MAANKRHWKWGRLNHFIIFVNYFRISKNCLFLTTYHFHIWQVSPQLSCGDTWQIWKWWKWFSEPKRCFCKVGKPPNGETSDVIMSTMASKSPASRLCLLNRLFRSKKTSKLRFTGLCDGNSPVTGEFPAQRASNAENVSIWWRHHE